VIVVEDENGNIVRETMKDNDVLAQYKSMRETLVYLCHLDYEDTEGQMLDKLRQQVAWEHGSVDGTHTACHQLTLQQPCWDLASPPQRHKHIHAR
jgi:exportin-1